MYAVLVHVCVFLCVPESCLATAGLFNEPLHGIMNTLYVETPGQIPEDSDYLLISNVYVHVYEPWLYVFAQKQAQQHPIPTHTHTDR